MQIAEELIKKVKKWLGEDGKNFFEGVYKNHGTLNAVYPEGEVDMGWHKSSIPHPVHLREGMQVRNFMRSTGLCDDWTAIDLDDNWEEVVKRALNLE
jgi:hypothetical protein